MVNHEGYKSLSLIVSILNLLLSIVIIVLNDKNYTENLFNIVSFQATIVSLTTIWILYKINGTIFKITIFFVVFYCLYMFGQLMLNTLGCLSTPFLSGKFSQKESIDGICDALMFLSFLIFGLMIPVKRHTSRRMSFDNHGVKVGYWIIAISLPFELIVAARKIYLSLTFGYASLYQDIAYDSIPSSYKILSYFFLPGVWYLYFSSKNKSRDEKVSICLLLLASVIFLLEGYRAIAGIPLILFIYGLRIKNSSSVLFIKKARRKALSLTVVFILLVLFVFPAMRESRNSGGLSTLELSEIISHNGLTESVNDMGKSIQTLIYTKRIVPEQEPYRYGYSYLMGLSTALPNLFWDRHPAEKYGSLGRWVTRKVDRDFYNFGGALGYSCVAEAYINFGYIGIVIIPFLMGWLLLYFENRVDSLNSPIYYASICIVAFYLFSFPRGELSDLTRGIAWYMLIPLITYKITQRKYISIKK